MPRGHRLDSAPEQRAWSERIVLAGADEPIYVDEDCSRGSTPEFREYVLQTHGVRLSIRYRADGRLEAIYRTSHEAGRVVSVEARENGVQWLESYEYDRERNLTAIQEPPERWPPDGVGWRDHGGRLDIVTASDGGLERVVNATTGHVIYGAPARPLEELLMVAADRLASEIPSWIEVPDGEVVRSMALVHGDPFAVVPTVVLDTEHPSRFEFDAPLEYDYGWLDDIQPLLEQELALAGAGEPAPAILGRIAERLNAGWEPSFPTTLNFVVYSVDREGEAGRTS